ncbi:MAG: hypothetical protein OXC37_05760 [Bdellovibrionaceae bacterium]|nr:hypothetical protein [Pseudobdellovibrionaceae bacterium]
MFQFLNTNQKFSTGSDLWVIFFEPDRPLFKKINWQSSFLLQSLTENEKLLKPRLIGTYKVFPNKFILCLPFERSSWVKDIYQSWKKMNKPSCRIFIPLGCKPEELINLWPEVDTAYNLHYYYKDLE